MNKHEHTQSCVQHTHARAQTQTQKHTCTHAIPKPTPQAAHREAKRASAAEKAAQKRERQAARKAAAERRGAATVVMSEEQRRRIEALIRGLDGTIGAGLSGDDDEGDDGYDDDEDEDWSGEEEDEDEGAAEAARRLARELQGLGFGERDAAAAVRAVGVGGGTAAALDWLILSLPEERLPRAYAPGEGARGLAGDAAGWFLWGLAVVVQEGWPDMATCASAF